MGIHRHGTSLVAQMVKASAYKAGDLDSIPVLGRSFSKGNGNPLKYFCLGNPMERDAWQATVHGVTNTERLTQIVSSEPQYSFP